MCQRCHRSPTLTALFLREPSSSKWRPEELDDLPKEFCPSRIGDAPSLKCSNSCLASTLHGASQESVCWEQVLKETFSRDLSKTSPPPGWANQGLHLLNEVAANHVLVAGDAQCRCHGVRVKRRVEYHDSAVDATVQEIFSKLLDGWEEWLIFIYTIKFKTLLRWKISQICFDKQHYVSGIVIVSHDKFGFPGEKWRRWQDRLLLPHNIPVLE